ncbi:MAG: ribosome small subunit-dependent GTPase A [Deltaproteobacteria bacterium]|nr:ribosome small subunit-dependent GTPase A [Deltaproteobacteria bacterium]
MELETLGWNAHWEEIAHSLLTDPNNFAARVAFAARDHLRLLGPLGELPAVLSGRARRSSPRPAAGDWVVAVPAPGAAAVVHAVLPRRSRLARSACDRHRGEDAAATEQVLAANLDWVIVVCGLDRDYNPRRIERYVTLAWAGGAQPVVVLNKADLRSDVDVVLREVEALAPGVAALAVSAARGEGVDGLRRVMAPGVTACLVGSSGAGKSTLLNRLLGGETQMTSATSESTGKGRHTTTRRELFVLPGGGVVIDTPGLRAVGLDLAEEGLDATFAEVAELADGCRFRDCRHQGEPGCAVAEAVAGGRLDPNRWGSYQRLSSEMRYRRLVADGGAALAERRRWRSVSKEARRMNRG